MRRRRRGQSSGLITRDSVACCALPTCRPLYGDAHALDRRRAIAAHYDALKPQRIDQRREVATAVAAVDRIRRHNVEREHKFAMRRIPRERIFGRRANRDRPLPDGIEIEFINPIGAIELADARHEIDAAQGDRIALEAYRPRRSSSTGIAGQLDLDFASAADRCRQCAVGTELVCQLSKYVGSFDRGKFGLVRRERRALTLGGSAIERPDRRALSD